MRTVTTSVSTTATPDHWQAMFTFRLMLMVKPLEKSLSVRLSSLAHFKSRGYSCNFENNVINSIKVVNGDCSANV